MKPRFIKSSVYASRLLERWLKIKLELFTPNLPAERRLRIKSVLDRIWARWEQVNPYKDLV